MEVGLGGGVNWGLIVLFAITPVREKHIEMLFLFFYHIWLIRGVLDANDPKHEQAL